MESIYDKGLGNWQVLAVGKPCQMKVNCFGWAFLTGMENIPFAKSVAAYQVPGDVLNYSNNKSKSDQAAAIGVST